MEKDHKTQEKPKAGKRNPTVPSPPSASTLNAKHQQIISQHLPIGIVETSSDGKYLDVNEEFCRMLGYEKHEMLRRGIKEVTDEEDFHIDLKLHNRLLAGEIPYYKIEKRFVRKDGRIVWADLTRSAIRDASGNALYTVGIVLDITERHLAEEALLRARTKAERTAEALRESEERFRAILSQATAGIVRKDIEGRFLFVNDTFCSMVGYSSSELVLEDKTCWDLTHPEDVDTNKRLWANMLQSGVPFQMERRLIRQDGLILWSNLSVSPVMDASGNPISVVAVEVDITARKQAEASLRQLNLELESRVAERTAELQTMNQVLQESRRRLQILSQRLVQVQEEERRSLARELHDQVGQSLMALKLNLTIIQGEISKGYTEQLEARLVDSIQLVAEVITLVRDVMSNLRPTILDDYGLESALQTYINEFQTRYGIPVQFERQTPPIPRLESSLEVTLLRISQEALTNIARHAQASQAILSLRLDEKHIHLTIEDNGRGLPEDARRPRSHGLKIMQERAQALEGTLTLQSAPGEGTKIEVSIPLPSGER